MRLIARPFAADAVQEAVGDLLSLFDEIGVVDPRYVVGDVRRYGAKGDRVTDDIVAFENAVRSCSGSGRVVFVPAVRWGNHYRHSRPWVVTAVPQFRSYGQGVLSIIVAANTTGGNGLTLVDCTEAHVRGLAFAGYAGSGHGVELTGSSPVDPNAGCHRCRIEDVHVGLMGGDGFKNTSGVSNRFINCRANQDNGYNPAQLNAETTEGSTQIGFHVPSHPLGYTNNATFIACNADGCRVLSIKVGDAGGIVDSFDWEGGTIQGCVSGEEIYLKAHDATIFGAHIEPSAALGKYILTFDACFNSHVMAGSLQGDVHFKGSQGCSVSRCNFGGATIDADSSNCVVEDGSFANIATGAAAGKMQDKGKSTRILNLPAADNALKGAGYFDGAQLVVAANGLEWDGANWAGWSTNGAALSQVADADGTNTIRMQISAAGFTQYTSKIIEPIDALRGRWVTVDAYVKNANGAAGKAFIQAVYDGSSTAEASSQFADGTIERMQAAFFVPHASLGFEIHLTGGNGADAQWYSVVISAQNYFARPFMALNVSATPTLWGRGGPTTEWNAPGSATPITGFLGGTIGKPFSISFAGAQTLTNSASLILAGGVNFVAKANDRITLVYRSDAKFQEVSRMVS